jgi:hypothetical protein
MLEDAPGIFGTYRTERRRYRIQQRASLLLAAALRSSFLILANASSMNQPQCACIRELLHRGTRSFSPRSSIHFLCPVSMVSTRQLMQPAKPFELRFVGPHYPASSVTGRLPAADPSPTNPRI